MLSIELPNSSRDFVVAYSGGVDSHVLLVLARQICLQKQHSLSAVHINHGLSPQAAEWADHCQKVCDTLEIPLQIQKVSVNSRQGNVEAKARTMRYQAFKTVLKTSQTLLLAHHADDQAETILMRLLRGSGPTGLSGMSPCSTLFDMEVCRPMLAIRREQIVEFAKQQSLSWIEDESNQQLDFDRNYLRQTIFPLLNKRWFKAQENINRAGSLIAQAEEFTGQYFKSQYNQFLGSRPGTLSIQALLQEDTYTRSGIIRLWLEQHQAMPLSLEQMRRLEKEVMSVRQDAMPQLVCGGKIYSRYRDDLYCLSRKQWATISMNYPDVLWDGQASIQLPCGKQLSQADNFSPGKYNVRYGLSGKTWKKRFQERGIPPWQRRAVPILFKDNEFHVIIT